MSNAASCSCEVRGHSFRLIMVVRGRCPFAHFGSFRTNQALCTHHSPPAYHVHPCMTNDLQSPDLNQTEHPWEVMEWEIWVTSDQKINLQPVHVEIKLV